MAKRKVLQARVSSDERFVEASRRRVGRQKQTAVLKWLVILAVVGALGYFVAYPYMMKTFGP